MVLEGKRERGDAYDCGVIFLCVRMLKVAGVGLVDGRFSCPPKKIRKVG
ncbi:unnamed protein product [marine sediment metagenome]|uniref:Uncharacterized protein n=1 Tax=marine sediment metagenome TaxID=412755 RepID=X1RZC6_9ZZZZ